MSNPNGGNRSRRQSTILLSKSIDDQTSPINLSKKTSLKQKTPVFIDATSPNFQSVNHDEIVSSLQKQLYFNQNKEESNDSNQAKSISGASSDVHEPLLKRNSMSSSRSSMKKMSFDDNSLAREGADITRDIYHNINNPTGISINKQGSNKPYSVDDIDLLMGTSYGSLRSSGMSPPPCQQQFGGSKGGPEIGAGFASRRESTASGLNVPGGFRRFHLVQKLDPTNSDHLEPITSGGPNNEDSNGGSSRRASFVSNIEDNEGDMNKLPFLTRNFLEFLYMYGHFAGESLESELYDEDELSFDYFSNSGPLQSKSKLNNLENQPLLPLDNNLVKKIEKIIHPRKTKGTVSTFKAFLLLIKSFIGTGILFLPKAFSNGGLLFSIIALMSCGIYSFWCYYILVRSKQATGVNSFGDIGLKLYGKWLKFFILFSLVLTQLGFSSTYCVFTSTNLRAFVNNVFKFDVPIQFFLLLQLIIFIPLSFIRNVSKLSITSLLANVLTLVGLVIVLFYIVQEFTIYKHFKPAEGVIKIFNPDKYTLAIGTFIFSFEGIGLIIPVSESMKHPEHFPKVLGLVIAISTFLFVVVATLGYSSYGKDIETIILLNLPQSSIFVNLIQFFYSLAIMLSTPLQLFPAIGIIENRIFFEKNILKKKKELLERERFELKWQKNTLRTVIVIFTICVAYLGFDSLDRFVSIVGCFACIPLVYIFPPMLHLKSVSKGIKSKEWFDYGLILFGICSMIFTSYQTIFGG